MKLRAAIAGMLIAPVLAFGQIEQSINVDAHDQSLSQLKVEMTSSDSTDLRAKFYNDNPTNYMNMTQYDAVLFVWYKSYNSGSPYYLTGVVDTATTHSNEVVFDITPAAYEGKRKYKFHFMGTQDAEGYRLGHGQLDVRRVPDALAEGSIAWTNPAVVSSYLLSITHAGVSGTTGQVENTLTPQHYRIKFPDLAPLYASNSAAAAAAAAETAARIAGDTANSNGVTAEAALRSAGDVASSNYTYAVGQTADAARVAGDLAGSNYADSVAATEAALRAAGDLANSNDVIAEAVLRSAGDTASSNFTTAALLLATNLVNSRSIQRFRADGTYVGNYGTDAQAALFEDPNALATDFVLFGPGTYSVASSNLYPFRSARIIGQGQLHTTLVFTNGLVTTGGAVGSGSLYLQDIRIESDADHTVSFTNENYPIVWIDNAYIDSGSINSLYVTNAANTYTWATRDSVLVEAEASALTAPTLYVASDNASWGDLNGGIRSGAPGWTVARAATIHPNTIQMSSNSSITDVTYSGTAISSSNETEAATTGWVTRKAIDAAATAEAYADAVGVAVTNPLDVVAFDGESDDLATVLARGNESEGLVIDGGSGSGASITITNTGDTVSIGSIGSGGQPQGGVISLGGTNSSLNGVQILIAEQGTFEFFALDEGGSVTKLYPSQSLWDFGGLSISNVSDTQTEIVTLSQLTTAWKAGVVGFDTDGMPFAHTAFSNVTINIGQEMGSFFYNDTGSKIEEGRLVNAGAPTNGMFTGVYWDKDNPAARESFLGICTVDGGTPDGDIGFATFYGGVSVTNLLVPNGLYYGGNNGLMTTNKPAYPAKRMIVGSALATNRFHVQSVSLLRPDANKSYSFSQRGIASGTYYKGGFYDFSSADANLDEGSLTVNYGSANVAYSAHPAIVASGAGSVDTGVVGLRVTGTTIDDEGVRTASDTNVISADITTITADTYYEAAKFNGTVTFELYVVSGSPTTYSLDFNYGYAKYEDYGNVDFSVTDFEVVGLAGGNDTSFDVTLLHHKTTGWTYAATGFEPGNSAICQWSTDMAPEDNLIDGLNFAYKRDNLDTFVEGSGSEGVIVKIEATANNSVQVMDVHIIGVNEEL